MESPRNWPKGFKVSLNSNMSVNVHAYLFTDMQLAAGVGQMSCVYRNRLLSLELWRPVAAGNGMPHHYRRRFPDFCKYVERMRSKAEIFHRDVIRWNHFSTEVGC